jgi:GNAT superfamily N-acetyltransferase
MSNIKVIRTYLQMVSPDELKAALFADNRLRVEQVIECPPSFFRYLYSEVGRNYHWVDRLGWTNEQIRAYISQPSVTLWVLYCAGAPGGYFELRQYEDDSVEIAYFGLLEEFIGRGLGKYLLTTAVKQAWKKTTSRIWVHTCTLDHPAALSNYLNRGFKQFRQETYKVIREGVRG